MYVGTWRMVWRCERTGDTGSLGALQAPSQMKQMPSTHPAASPPLPHMPALSTHTSTPDQAAGEARRAGRCGSAAKPSIPRPRPPCACSDGRLQDSSGGGRGSGGCLAGCPPPCLTWGAGGGGHNRLQLLPSRHPCACGAPAPAPPGSCCGARRLLRRPASWPLLLLHRLPPSPLPLLSLLRLAVL